jgi:hypothetical protein
MTGATPQRLKAFLANIALVVISLAITYFIGEFVFFRDLLPDMSMNLRPHLPDRADFFLQNSKAQRVPHDYIALLGDSYAQGMGDWLLAVGGKSDQPYHSANVIHDLLGRDVVTFGRASAGSAEGMVLRLTRILGDGYCYIFPPIEAPKQFVVYFYEGNDIDDNNELLRRAIKDGPASLAARVDKFLDTDYGVVSSWRCHGHLGDMMFRMARFVIRDAFATHHVIDLPATKNRVMAAGVATATSELQVPSMDLNEQQIDDGVTVYDRSLAWLLRNYPNTPTTVIYIPAPASTYRQANPEVISKDVFIPAESRRAGRLVIVDGRPFPATGIYEHSQRICEKIRVATLRQGVAFIDARPIMRKAGAQQAIHGPRDWNHPNERGYRILGGLVAARINDHPADACDDSWPAPP